ncbi:uncharacterized protein [Diabrotica undecimpunctata]|uniref:uncharacterized protein n=1 Tax=Diabrotica undecimpunctata TaxID=50387 RepID=UPI003B636B97
MCTYLLFCCYFFIMIRNLNIILRSYVFITIRQPLAVYDIICYCFILGIESVIKPTPNFEETTEYTVDKESGDLVEVTNYAIEKTMSTRTVLVPYTSSDEDSESENTGLATLQHPIEMELSDEVLVNDEEKRLTRWRKSDPQRWHRNRTKEQMNKGQEYVSTRGIIRPPKAPQPISCQNSCRYKCNIKFNEEERKKICKEYWGLQLFERKMDFILQNVAVNSPKTRRPRNGENSKMRGNAKTYHFFKGNEKIRVCLTFFMKTLNINNGPIMTAFKNRNPLGVFEGEDKRGKRPSANRTPDVDIARVKAHIESFPIMESHYCRKSTNRLYLDSRLSISKMYEPYSSFCLENNFKAVTMHVYRKIFGTQYNLSFFKPRKDQCQMCDRYTASDAEKRRDLEEDYRNHIMSKNDAAKAKEIDKSRSQDDPSFLSATFDLQSVLQIPSSDVSSMYYTRKVNMYNLTIYETPQPHKAYCFAWSELNGKRGSSKIGTCLYKWFETLQPEVKHITVFSDTCGGQNRNQNIVALFLYLVQVTSIDIIEHKFLESSHSYMEVDSMHSAIEKEKKYQPVYIVNDWLSIFKRARSKRNRNKNYGPYITKELKFTEFLDLKDLSRHFLKNKLWDCDNQKVNWLKVKCFRFKKGQSNVVEYRYDYFGEYKKINIEGRVRTSRKTDCTELELKKLYNGALPISINKKADLIKLCEKEVIPSEYHGWYRSLPTSSTVRDIVPETENLENDE